MMRVKWKYLYQIMKEPVSVLYQSRIEREKMDVGLDGNASFYASLTVAGNLDYPDGNSFK